MKIVENGEEVDWIKEIDLGGKRIVIGNVEEWNEVGNIGLGGWIKIFKDRKEVEIGIGDESSGVMEGIKDKEWRVEIGVDEIEVEGGEKKSREVDKEVIEIVNMKVGIGKDFEVVVEKRKDIVRKISKSMRKEKNERRI